MTACTWPASIVRSTPLTISVPSSRATCRFLISNNAIGPSLAQPSQQSERRPGRALPRPAREASSGPRVARQRLEEVVGSADRLGLAGVLVLPAHSPKHPVARAARQLLAPEELLSSPADPQLAHRPLA